MIIVCVSLKLLFFLLVFFVVGVIIMVVSNLLLLLVMGGVKSIKLSVMEWVLNGSKLVYLKFSVLVVWVFGFCDVLRKLSLVLLYWKVMVLFCGVDLLLLYSRW